MAQGVNTAIKAMEPTIAQPVLDSSGRKSQPE
jgi:hypothetical protein